MIKVGIVGATGYAGAELVRLITAHPEAEIAAISSVSFEGQKLSDVYPAYKFLNDMTCENQDAVVEKSDVIFAALPHGLSQELGKKCIDSGKAFIDLGADFRLESEDEYAEWYGGEFLDKELHAQSVYAGIFQRQNQGQKACCQSRLLYDLLSACDRSGNCERTDRDQGHYLRLQERRYRRRQKAYSGQSFS